MRTAGGVCASQCPNGQSDGDDDGVCTVDDPWPENGCPGTQVDRDPRPGTTVCSTSCRPNAHVVDSTGVCACNTGYELDSIGRCVDPYPNNGCDTVGQVNRNGQCHNVCGANSTTRSDGYCPCTPDYRYPNETTLHCSPCADGLVPNGRVCVACATDHAETSAGSCTKCDAGDVPDSTGTACVACGTDHAETVAGSCSSCSAGEVPNGTGTACVACGPGRAEKNAGTCEQCANGTEPNTARTACRHCPTDTAGTDGICTECVADHVPNAARTECEGCPTGERESSPGICTPDGSCGADEIGTYPDCTACDDGEVPNSTGTACVACGTDHAETVAGSCSSCSAGEVPNGTGTACVACGPGRAEKNAGTCEQCANGTEPNTARTACRHCPTDTAGTDGICTECVAGHVPNAARTECEGCPTGERESSPGICTPDGSCGADEIGTYPDCTACDDGEVPNSAGTACVACGTDHAETVAGSCSSCSAGEVPNGTGTACVACGPGRAEKNAGTCEQCANGTEPNTARTACRHCPTDTAGTDGICTECVADHVPNAARTECVPCPTGQTETQAGTCTGSGSCSSDQTGAPPDCTDCGRHRVPDAAGTACGACPEGQEEGFPGQCMPVGNCTRLGSYWPDAESGCVRAGRVAANAQCMSTCRAKSADNGWGICVCDPGYVYTVAAGAIFGPTKCVRRTDELCGAASDPGTCEPGTWNSGTARCDCGDGFERSDDGRSCECATDDAEQTGYLASVLFPNPQSLFDGLRVGFVNTSSGNLTFRRRDIVTRAQGPAVFARVHDSRIAADDDFGPGWRLSLAEELLVDGDAATYVDESGARHTFAWTGTAWTASPPTPRHAATTLQFADAGGIRTAVLADGDAVRTFEQAGAAGARYVVRLVRTPARELVLDYDGGRLAAVSHDGATLFEAERDRAGRIAALRDDHGRSVRYAYDADGRLETVRDIAGSDWEYRYRDDGLLGGAVDPEGRTYLAADYDAEGRAVRAYGGRLHEYAYAPEGTTVAEATGETHTLTRNAAGVTTALSSTTGTSWSLALDAANRVSTLTLPARTIGYAYGGHGRVATMTVADAVSGTTRMRSYDYDGQGRLIAVSGGGADATVTYAAGLVRIDEGSDVFEYETDDRGWVARVRRGADPEIRVERDGAGDIVEVSQGHRSVRFGRDDLGRIVDAAFADGSSARYFYDDLGNRTRAQYGHGGSVAYDYDAAGKLASVKTTERDGSVGEWTAIVGTGLVERIAASGNGTVDAEYDGASAAAATEAFSVQRNGPAGVEDKGGASQVVRAGAPPEPRSPDAGASVLMRDHGAHGQPSYGIVSVAGDLRGWRAGISGTGAGNRRRASRVGVGGAALEPRRRRRVRAVASDRFSARGNARWGDGVGRRWPVDGRWLVLELHDCKCGRGRPRRTQHLRARAVRTVVPDDVLGRAGPDRRPEEFERQGSLPGCDRGFQRRHRLRALASLLHQLPPAQRWGGLFRHEELGPRCRHGKEPREQDIQRQRPPLREERRRAPLLLDHTRPQHGQGVPQERKRSLAVGRHLMPARVDGTCGVGHLAVWCRAVAATVAALASGTVLAEVRAACEYPDAGVFEQTGVLCSDEMPASAERCRRALDTLARTESPTVEQRLALAFGRSWAAVHADDAAARDAERLGHRELTALASANPNDPMVLRALLVFAEDQKEWVALLRRIVDLDPGCEKAWHYLIRALPSESEADWDERLARMLDAYKHARSWKLNFAALVYVHLERDDVHEARAFRATVVRDMGLETSALDAENRAASLGSICHHDPFAMRLELLCLDAIREALGQDISAGMPVDEDVLRAAERMAEVAGSAGVVWLDGVSPDFGEDGPGHMAALREILDGVPEDRRTAEFHLAYANMVGPQRQVAELRLAWAFDRSEGRIGLLLADALIRMGSGEEVAATYRTVIANDDGRACWQGDSTTCGEVAAGRLREFELRAPSID